MKNNIKLWICGRYWGQTKEKISAWELFGVFDSHQKAFDACTTKTHFIGPVILNERFPDKPEIWPGAYYPKLQDHP